MTTIVTGYHGFIGKRLFNRLSGKNVEVFGYDNRLGAFPNLAEAFNDVDVIYHLGALSGIVECSAEKETALKANVVSVEHWCKYAVRKNARLVFTSSVAAGSVSPSFYGITKRMGEDVIGHYVREHGLKASVYRLPNIYGPGSIEKNSVVAKMCKDAINTGKVYVHGSGKERRNFLRVDDLVRHLTTEKKQGFFEIESGSRFSIVGLAEIIANKFHAHIVFTDKRQEGLRFESKVISSIIVPTKCPFDIGLQETVDYFKTEMGGNDEKK